MAIFASTLLCTAPGCGPNEELGHVTGQVLYQGEPVTTGTITFADTKRGLGVIAPLGPDGRYEMRTHKRGGLLPGVYRVSLSSHSLSTGDPLVGAPSAAAPPGKFPKLPEKYFNVTTSGLEAHVVKGENVFDFKFP